MSNEKILKYLILTIIIIPIILIVAFYSWFFYEASKININEQAFTEEMKSELMTVAGIKESMSFKPINLRLLDGVGPSYYNSYELEFEISKEDYEKNNLSYGIDGDYDSLTDASKMGKKNKNTYICHLKYTKPVNEDKYVILENVYKQLKGKAFYTGDSNVSDPEVYNNNTDTTNSVNAPATTKEFIDYYDKDIENLDLNYFVKDFENYKSGDKSKNLTNSQISEIAEAGFKESAKRIAGEGASNKESERITTEEIIPNNYFTRGYSEKQVMYNNLKMNAYVVTRENEMYCGIKIYIDPTTGLIVGGEAFGD